MHCRHLLLSLGLLPLFCAAANAAPRDDVIAGAVRCTHITDDRAWLDCYYGAAQPMRARLGLPPAPASQVALVPAPGAVGRPLAAAAPPPEKKGLLGQVFGGSGDFQMTSYKFDHDGLFTVTLANGEVWQQLPLDVNYAHWRGPAANYRVSVAEGGFGHSDMTVDNDDSTYEVRRIN